MSMGFLAVALDGANTLSDDIPDGSIVNGNGGDDDFFVSGLNNTVNGGDGNDTIMLDGPTGEGVENTAVVNGDAGDDVITAVGFGDTLNGGEGDDYIYTKGNLTAANGDAGNDTVISDILDSGGGTPVFGGDGDDFWW